MIKRSAIDPNRSVGSISSSDLGFAWGKFPTLRCGGKTYTMPGEKNDTGSHVGTYQTKFVFSRKFYRGNVFRPIGRFAHHEADPALRNPGLYRD